MKKLFVVVVALVGLSACEGKPREQHVQWVARDQWDSSCAEQAAIERWSATNGRWKVKPEVYVVDVDATFKMVNKCSSGLPLIGKTYAQFDAVAFKGTVEMSHCKKDCQDGWSLPQKESSRCWTGPTLLGAK